jgi:hypothetical protein
MVEGEQPVPDMPPHGAEPVTRARRFSASRSFSLPIHAAAISCPLLTAAVERGGATIMQQAYLTDRVLLHEGQPQEYGTRAIARNGRFEPRKLLNPDHVDQRRASVGLGPLAGYLARMAGQHAPEPNTGAVPGLPGDYRGLAAGRGRDPHRDLPGVRAGAHLPHRRLRFAGVRLLLSGRSGTWRRPGCVR